ncbi:MAG: hypothetical protein R3C30_09350 [Hyphomonadaceae bacterium]
MQDETRVGGGATRVDTNTVKRVWLEDDAGDRFEAILNHAGGVVVDPEHQLKIVWARRDSGGGHFEATVAVLNKTFRQSWVLGESLNAVAGSGSANAAQAVFVWAGLGTGLVALLMFAVALNVHIGVIVIALPFALLSYLSFNQLAAGPKREFKRMEDLRARVGAMVVVG